jgi:putative endonuclease
MAPYTRFLTTAKPCARWLWMNARLGITARSGRRFVSADSDGGVMTTLTRAEIGALGEQLAVEHLTSLGLRVLTRNWRCRYGELDVIAVDDAAHTVVFVEVKTRTSDQFGGVSQAVTPLKVRRLRRLAGLWLATQRGSWAAVRIDVIGVRIGRTRSPEITHLEAVG